MAKVRDVYPPPPPAALVRSEDEGKSEHWHGQREDHDEVHDGSDEAEDTDDNPHFGLPLALGEFHLIFATSQLHLQASAAALLAG